MITTAVIPCFLQVSAAILNCSGVSILVLPEPIISKPPVFLNSLIYSSSNTKNLSSVNPEGPPLKPINTLSLLVAFNASYKPETTLCPPGACPPDKIG